MNLLIDRLPTTVEVNDLQYPINTDFRISRLFELLLMDNELSDQEKLLQAVKLYYPVMPFDLDEAIEQILWFYQGGKDAQVTEDADVKRNTAAVYSFDHDDQYIYAAFLDQYGVDLQDAKLHWWKFKAMFAGLKEDNKICKIMSYRATEISNDMPKAQKEFYKKMKTLYAIPQPQLEIERTKASELENALMGNGDLTGIL